MSSSAKPAGHVVITQSSSASILLEKHIVDTTRDRTHTGMSAMATSEYLRGGKGGGGSGAGGEAFLAKAPLAYVSDAALELMTFTRSILNRFGQRELAYLRGRSEHVEEED